MGWVGLSEKSDAHRTNIAGKEDSIIKKKHVENLFGEDIFAGHCDPSRSVVFNPNGALDLLERF